MREHFLDCVACKYPNHSELIQRCVVIDHVYKVLIWSGIAHDNPSLDFIKTQIFVYTEKKNALFPLSKTTDTMLRISNSKRGQIRLTCDRHSKTVMVKFVGIRVSENYAKFFRHWNLARLSPWRRPGTLPSACSRLFTLAVKAAPGKIGSDPRQRTRDGSASPVVT